MDFLTLSVLLHMHYAENETNINCIQKALEKILDNPLSTMTKCKDYIHSLTTFNIIADPNANDLNSTTFIENSSFLWLINRSVTGRTADLYSTYFYVSF